VSLHEQTRGAHAAIQAARRSAEVIWCYGLLETILNDFTTMTVRPFDDAAAMTFSGLKAACARVGMMDLRIASIALSRELTLLTRNRRDFGNVPNLITEDWTA
jgi:tRNA(fMet)-specific endonuclease VapC